MSLIFGTVNLERNKDQIDAETTYKIMNNSEQ